MSACASHSCFTPCACSTPRCCITPCVPTRSARPASRQFTGRLEVSGLLNLGWPAGSSTALGLAPRCPGPAWQCSLTMYYEVCLAPTAHACPRIIASHTVICLRPESNRLQTPRHVPVTLQVRSSRKRPARRQNRAKTVRAGSRLAPWLEWGDFKWVGPRGHVAAVRGLRCERRRARK